MERATRAVLDRVGQTLCRSRADADLLGRAFPAAMDRLQVVPDGIDAPEIRAAKPFTTSASVVLAVGRLERRKHVERAIATMASLPPAYQLVVVGDGPARRGLRAHAADLQVSPRVHFAGQVSDSDLHRWLRTARVVLALAEEAGGSGLQVLEAIAAGVPVVASDIPAHREAASYTAGEGVTFVSPEGSPLEVADAIAQAATGPADGHALSGNVPGVSFYGASGICVGVGAACVA